jgi:hypothetical protein
VAWTVERIVHFGPDDFVKAGLAHFGFHVRDGRYYAVAHERHYLGVLGQEGRVEWTVAAKQVLDGVPNIAADLEFPIYVDALPDGSLVVSNFGSAQLHRIDAEAMRAEVLVDGRQLGMADMGNCVVDDEGTIWVNEVTGCRIWRFGPDGRPLETLGDGVAGFQPETAGFEEVRFSWIYDIRPAPDGRLLVLDSRNFALRAIDVPGRNVRTIAGTGSPGYTGDGARPGAATFGGDASARFDGPISLAVDEAGNAYVGDRFNHVVRMIDRASGLISTIAGRADARAELANDPVEPDPLRLSLPAISSLDYAAGRLFVPTDLAGGHGDLVVLTR